MLVVCLQSVHCDVCLLWHPASIQGCCRTRGARLNDMRETLIPCPIRVLSVSYPCPIRVLSVSYPCPIQVRCSCIPGPIRVLYVSCTDRIRVLSGSYRQVVFLQSRSTGGRRTALGARPLMHTVEISRHTRGSLNDMCQVFHVLFVSYPSMSYPDLTGLLFACSPGSLAITTSALRPGTGRLFVCSPGSLQVDCGCSLSIATSVLRPGNCKKSVTWCVCNCVHRVAYLPKWT